MKYKRLFKSLSLLLALATLISALAVSVGAASLNDSNSVTVSSDGRDEYLLKSTGGTIGSNRWTFTSNDGLTGVAYCVNWGLSNVSPNKALTLQPYSRNPKTMGAFANGYPQRTLEQFKTLHEGNIRGLEDLTENEYQYATQLAVWATCGQLSVPGTSFTAGRAALVEPTSDARQIRTFDSVKAILSQLSGWTRFLYPGMYLRAEKDLDVRGVEITNENGLEGAAIDNENGIKKETIGGVEYYTRTMYVASATSTWIDGYTTKVYSTDAPQGTIFTAENGSALETVTENGVTYFKVDTSNGRATNLNANGEEYYGGFKVCIPADTAAESGSFTIKAIGGAAQYNLFLAYNPSAAEQSYIVADPAYTTCDALATFSWSRGGDPNTAHLQVVKTDGAGAPLEGAEFTLTGSGGTVVTGTSDRNGQITWRDLPSDETFTLVETKAPDGYQIVEPVSITLTPGQMSFVTVKDNLEESFQIKKIDTQNKGALQGAVFVFEQIDDTYKTSGITGFDGIIEFVGDELPYGSYRIYEQSSPAGYVKSDRIETVEWTGERDVTIVWENTRDITLTIVKVDEQSGVSLPGAVFDVYADGKYFTSVTTNDAGEAYVSGIKEEAYIEVVETAAPPGYVLDRTSHGIHIDPYDPTSEDDPVLVVTNRARPALRIVKYDAQTMQPLSDTTFEVYHDGSLLGEYTTDGNGEIFLYDLDPGTYLISEIAAKDSYVVNSTPQEIELEEGAASTYSVVFLNYLKPGMHLTKLDSQSMEPLANVRFRISEIGGDFSKEFVTDINGEIDLTSLEPASYLVEELEAPEGYVIDDVQRTIKLEPGVNAQFVFTNTREPSLHLIKRSSDGTPLEGVTFRIARIEDGSRYLDRTTDENGEIVLHGLEPGVYSVLEVATVSDHIIDPLERHVELFPGETSTIVLENSKRPNLYVYKRDADTGEPIPNTVFLVEAADGHSVDEIKTDADGRAELKNLLPGVYQISEKSVPSPWLMDAEPQLVTLYPDRDHTAYFENHKKPSITIIKEDSISGVRLADAKFSIQWASSKSDTGEIRDLGIYYTDAQGRIELEGLEDGWLKITESEAPSGYAIQGDGVHEAFIRGGESKTIQIKNEPLSALVVWKYDSVSGEALEGAVFQVKYLSGTSGSGGTVIGTFQTGPNGAFTVTGLAAGAYVVEELASDADHVIDTAPQTVYISGEKQAVVQLYFGNAPKGSLLVKKISASDGTPLSDVQFFVTESDGTVVGTGNGYFTTDSSGSFLIEGIAPGTTLVVKETRAKPGYLLDGTPQTAVIQAGQTVSLEFRNQPAGGLVIYKQSSTDKTPLEGVQFKITYADGQVVDAEGGKLSSNGLYWTDENGQIRLDGITGTLIVTEMETIPGYTIHEESRSQTVVVNPDDLQTLYFYNDPLGGVEIVKVNAANKTERIPNTTFEIRRVDGELVDTATTDKNGRVFVSLPDGAYYAVEIEAGAGFKVDPSPIYFEVEDGKTVQLQVTNQAFSGIIIHKIDSVSGEGIYDVKFVLYDANKRPIGEYSTDNEGYVYIDDLTVSDTGSKSRFYLRELEAAEGYSLDKEYKTVYIRAGETVEIEWENTPITGQIQVYKYAAAANSVTGTSAGAPLQGAVYEIVHERSGKVVDYITTDARGVAASKPLPLGRYQIVEVTAPAYWQVDPTVHDVTLEFEGQIIKISAYDKPSELGVSITKRSNVSVLAGSSMRYDFTLANTSNVDLENFYFHDRIPTDIARASTLTTGTYSARLNYRILYKTNYSASYQVLASNLLTSNNYSFGLSALPMQAGEYVTDIYFDFGKVPVGFQSVHGPTLNVVVNGNAVNGYQMVNRSDVGGKYQGTWQTAQANWVTIIQKLWNTPELPKTGY